MDVSRLWAPVSRWGEFRRAQLAALEQSNHIAARAVGSSGEPAGGDGTAAPVPAASSTGTETPDGPTASGSGAATTDPSGLGDGAGSVPVAPYGIVGRPLNRHSPFYIGFFGATGAILAVGLWQLAGRLTTTLTVLVVAFFLTLALNPIVDRLVRHGVRRAAAVAVVFGGVIVVFVLLGFLVIPPVVDQGGQLAQQAPRYVQDVLDSRWVRELDKSYDVIDKVQAELSQRMSDQRFLEGVLGGILGAGRAVISGTFQTLTILVLTLYFLAALPRVKQGAYAIVPASRRARFVSLSEEIMRRVGSYAIGQVSIATFNAIMSYVMMSILGIPYAAVLAVSVGLLGLVPMVGATLGAVLVCLVAFFDDPQKMVIAAIYYIVYQQVENYLIAPRIMQRTVSVPGPVTVVAALAGGALLGVLGALLAIPVAAGLLLLYEEVLVPRQRRA